MDFPPVLQPIFNALWYLLPLAILAGVIKFPMFKGWTGECLVNISARLFLDKNTYHLTRNVTLPTEDGTTKIDHVIVSCYDVFGGLLRERLKFELRAAITLGAAQDCNLVENKSIPGFGSDSVFKGFVI